MAYYDFAEIKSRISLEAAAEMLNLPVKKSGSQFRCECPLHGGGDRSLAITPGKGWYCQAARKGGDVIALVAHIEEIGMKEAAGRLTEQYGSGDSDSSRWNSKVPVPEESEERKGHGRGSEPLRPLDYLQADHEALEALGLSPETLEFFEAGYAPRGIMRGRLAIPIHDLTGQLVAYCGRAVKDGQEPMLTFPKGFAPEQYVFNLHRAEGAIHTTNDPLDVLMEYEHTGESTMVSFLHRPTNVVPLKKRA